MDYCSQIAHASQAPLHGTAAQFRVGLLLEYGGEWRNKALANNDMPAEIMAWIDGLKSTIPNCRPLFIRKGSSRSAVGAEPKSFYVTVNDVGAPLLYRFSFTDYAELLEIDVAALVDGTSDTKPVDETVVAVCTNGKHDACCAKFGLPVAQGFEQEFGSESNVSVWQCTHIGGHRYAATAVALPTGVVYGFLTPDNVPTVAQAIRAGEIHLPCYRGCVAYPGTVSAADYYARKESGQMGVSALTMVSAQETGRGTDEESLWRVEFKNGGSPHHVVELAQWMTEPIVSSCGDKPPKPQVQYRLEKSFRAS